MIVSKDFVFIHFPKTGGSFIRKILQDTAPSEWDIQEVGPHVPISDLPAEYNGLPVFGFVRNPFDWYVSWYTYLREEALNGGTNNQFFNRVSKYGARGFKETLEAIFELNVAREKQFDCFFRDSVFGCHLNSYFGNDLSRIEIGRFERLRDDLLKILHKYTDPPKAMVSAVRSQTRVNVSQRNPYRAYYGKELQGMVTRRDRQVLDYFGYKF